MPRSSADEDGVITYFIKDASGNVSKSATFNGNGPTLYVLAQSVQADCFDDAATSLEAAFGTVTATNNP